MSPGQDVRVEWTFSKPENYGLFSWIVTYNNAGSLRGYIEEYTNTRLTGFFRNMDSTTTMSITFNCRLHWLLDDTRINGI